LDEWAAEEAGYYRVVRLWYVLEHIRQPGRLLRQALKVLRDGGLLVVGVPNDAGQLSRRLMRAPEDRFWEHTLHLHHFPPFGLEEWIRGLGYDLILGEASRPAELMRGGSLPLNETWEEAREAVPELCRIFYKLGVGRGRELIFRKIPRT
jgi:SAM-dependent methyltransferase